MSIFGSSFWGPSDAMQEAGGWPREYGAYTKQAFKDNLTRQQGQQAEGDATNQWYRNYNMNRATNGIGDVAHINEYGQQIMPGIDQYVSDKNARLQQQQAALGLVPTAGQTSDKIDSTIAQQNQNISDTRDYALNDAADTYHRSVGNQGTAFTDAQKAIELMRPGGQFAQATAARSFAGQAAATGGALRRSGLDPSSPQAISAMQRVYTDRSRAIDDAASKGTAAYAQARSGLDLSNADTLNNLDSVRSGRAVGAQNTAMDRYTGTAHDAEGAALTRKALGQQDWDTQGKMNSQFDDAQLEGIGLHQQQFNAGANYNSANMAAMDKGAAGVGQYGRDQINDSYKSGDQALQYGNTAMNAYNTTYAREAPKAGWGAKMLAGVAGGALNMVAPGVGTALTGGVNAGLPQQGGQANYAGGQPGYGGGMPSGATDMSGLWNQYMNRNNGTAGGYGPNAAPGKDLGGW